MFLIRNAAIRYGRFLNNVNFPLTVGTAVPRDVRIQTLPSDVVEVVPQYRGYSFFVVRDESSSSNRPLTRS
jgi:hypothetical protein